MRLGKSIPATLEHLVFVPTSEGREFPTLIAMHGRGADENDLASLVLELEIPNLLLITPRAPFDFPYGGNAWYTAGQEGVPDPETFRTSMELLQKFLEQVKVGYPVDRKRLTILGFSQGAMMAYATTFSNPSMFHGLVALSGYLPTRWSSQFQPSNLTDFPVFISHGLNDMIIPIKFGREAVKALTDAGANVTYREYLMGHEIREETIRDLRQWILNTLQVTQG